MQFLFHKEEKSFFESRRLRLFLMVFFMTAALAGLAFVLAPNARGLLHSSAESDTGGQVQGAAAVVFKDVPSTDDNAAAIALLSNEGMISGFNDGTFRPREPVKREEFIKLVVAAKNADPHLLSNNHCFKDVGAEWFARYVCYAKRMGWVQGYDGGMFGSGEDITGEEAITIISRSFGVEVPDQVLGSEGDLLRGQAAGLVVRALESSRSAPAL